VPGPLDEDVGLVPDDREESALPVEELSPVPLPLRPPSDELGPSDELDRSEGRARSDGREASELRDRSDEGDRSDESARSDESPRSDEPARSDALELSEDPVDAAAASPSGLFDRRAAEPRSFFAQPEPLKWIVGGAKPLRTGPLWQEGHSVGPEAFTPWITSKRCPQLVQT